MDVTRGFLTDEQTLSGPIRDLILLQSTEDARPLHLADFKRASHFAIHSGYRLWQL